MFARLSRSAEYTNTDEYVGVMQDYFEQNKFSDASNLSLQLSFVGTLALVFANLMGPFAQILESVIGPRLVMLIGALLITIGLMMAGFAWQV